MLLGVAWSRCGGGGVGAEQGRQAENQTWGQPGGGCPAGPGQGHAWEGLVVQMSSFPAPVVPGCWKEEAGGLPALRRSGLWLTSL